MLGVGGNRSLRRIIEQGGLCVTGKNTARPRHHGGLRAVEEREHEGEGEGQGGAGSNIEIVRNFLAVETFCGSIDPCT